MEFIWRVTRTDFDTTDGCIIKAFFSCTSGNIVRRAGLSFATPTGEMTPYDAVTEDMVLSWVWSSVDKDVVEAEIAASAESTIESGTPWPATMDVEPVTPVEDVQATKEVKKG